MKWSMFYIIMIIIIIIIIITIVLRDLIYVAKFDTNSILTTLYILSQNIHVYNYAICAHMSMHT